MINHKIHRRFVIGTIVLFAVLALHMITSPVLVFFFSGNPDYIRLSVSLIYSFFNVLRLFFVVQFFLACTAVWNRIEIMNEYLEDRFQCKSLKVASKKCFDCHKIGKNFHILCDAIRIINDTFTFKFLFIFMNNLVEL